jgi:hypothetical protein
MMFAQLKIEWQGSPLRLLLALALLIRLVAAVFSKGYGMLDDHFLIIEIPWNYLDLGGNWFTDQHTSLYAGLHYLLLYLFKAAGLEPQSQMFIIRLIHATYSILIVLFGYKIALLLSNKDIAKKAGLVLALFWILPFMSARNLVEVVAIPPAMAAFYYGIKFEREARSDKAWFLVGALFALSFIIRSQCVILLGGAGLTLLFQRKLLAGIFVGAGFLTAAFLTQGLVDIAVYGYPFAGFIQYSTYNATHAFDYTTGAWHVYLLLFIGIFIPPLSFIALYAFARMWKEAAFIFFPTLLFFVFHSYFPNKQERFIFTIVPMVITLAVVGFERFVKTASFWQSQSKWLRGIAVWSWIANAALLIPFTLHYSKKTRVEAMTYLSAKSDVNGVVVAGGKLGIPFMPWFYLGKHVPSYQYSSADSASLSNAQTSLSKSADFPNYVIFLGKDDLEARVQAFEKTFSKQTIFETEIEPSFLDHVFYVLNPRFNINQSAIICRVK